MTCCWEEGSDGGCNSLAETECCSTSSSHSDLVINQLKIWNMTIGLHVMSANFALLMTAGAVHNLHQHRAGRTADLPSAVGQAGPVSGADRYPILANSSS